MEVRAVWLLQGRPPVCGDLHRALLHGGPQCTALRRGLRALGSAQLCRLLPRHGAALETAAGEKAQGHYDDGRYVHLL